jgi:hypothetical protein
MKEATPDTSRLRELAKAATSGPWEVKPVGFTVGLLSPSAGRWITDITGWHYRSDPDFIAAANPAVVLSLLDRIEELEEQLRLANIANSNAFMGVEEAFAAGLKKGKEIKDASQK